MSSTQPQTASLRSSARSRTLGKIFLVTLGGMTVFEVVKSLVHPTVSLWGSHFATILFSGFAAVVGGTVALKRYEELQQQLVDLIAEQAQTEKQLRQAQEELEKRVTERTADLVRANATLRLEVAERKQTEEVARGQTSALTRTLHLLASSSSVDVILAHVLTAISEQLQAFSSLLFLYDAENQCLRPEMGYQDGIISSRQQESGSLLDRQPPLALADHQAMQVLFRTQAPIAIDDVSTTTLFSYPENQWAQQCGIKSALLIPLVLDGKFLGSLHVRHRAHHTYRPEEISPVVALSHQAVLALQITRLAEQGQRTAVLTERNRMAREIHDTLSQGFTGIIVQLEAADDVLEETPEETLAIREHIARAGALARESLAEARRSVFNLRPQVLEHESLQAALIHAVQTLTAGTSVQADFSVTGAPSRLPLDVEEHLLRVGQQALTNVMQHAQARHVRVQLIFTAQQIRLRIQDDGRGLDCASKHDLGFGLIGMRQRVEQIGGWLSIVSLPDRGTTVMAAVPLPPQYTVGTKYDDPGEDQPHSYSDRR